MEALLETVEGDLAHHRVEPVLDLAGQQRSALGGRGLGQQALEHEALAEDRGRLRQRQRRVGQQRALRRRQRLVHGVAELVRERQHVSPLVHVIQEHVGVLRRGHRVRERAGGLARPRLGVDPRAVEEGPRPVGEGGGQRAEALQHDRLGLLPAVDAGRRFGERGVAVPVVQLRQAERLGLERVVLVAEGGVGLRHRLHHHAHALGVDLVGEVAAGLRVGEAAPAVLHLLLEGDRVQHQRQHGHLRLQRGGEGMRGLLAPGGGGVGEAVQRLGEGQRVGTDLHLQPRERLVVQAHPAGHGGRAVDEQALQVRGELVIAPEAHAAQPRAPARRLRPALQRRFDLPLLQLVQLQREEQGVRADGGCAGAHVTFELGGGGVVARGGGGERGEGADGPQKVGDLLVERDRLIDQQAQALGISSRGGEGALQAHQLGHGGARALQVGLHGGVRTAGVEVVEAPLGQGLAREGVGRLVLGHGAQPIARRMNGSNQL